MENNKTNEKNLNLASREMMKQEAIRRMMSLDMHEKIIHDFEAEGTVRYSEGVIHVALATEYKDIIDSFEKNTNNLVYHLIISETDFGKNLSLLYVSNDKNKWGTENKFIKAYTPYVAYCNLENPSCLEYGFIHIRTVLGGLFKDEKEAKVGNIYQLLGALNNFIKGYNLCKEDCFIRSIHECLYNLKEHVDELSFDETIEVYNKTSSILNEEDRSKLNEVASLMIKDYYDDIAKNILIDIRDAKKINNNVLYWSLVDTHTFRKKMLLDMVYNTLMIEAFYHRPDIY